MGGGWTEYHDKVVEERLKRAKNMSDRVQIEDSVARDCEKETDEFVARAPSRYSNQTEDEAIRSAQLALEAIGPREIERCTKDTNPKDAVGVRKAPVSTVPGTVIAELGLAMLEGARKYGRHNYRIAGVRASVYRDAVWRHMNKWWEGEDIDPDSGLSHITKAIASLTVLRDAMILENWVDDRPPTVDSKFWETLDKKAADIIEKYPDAKEPFTHDYDRP